VSNYKEPQDKKAAYLSRDGKWFKMDKESVRKVCGRPRLRNTAKIAFFGLQPHFHDGDGLFLTPLAHVAQELGTTTDKLSEDIDILVEVGIFRRTQTGLLYDPVSYKLITKNEEPPDAKFCRISPDSAKFGENLHSPLGQNAPLDKIRASSLDASNAASKERSDSISYQNEADGKKGEGSLRLPSLFSRLKMKEIEEVRQANLDLDWSDVCSEFVRVNQEKQTPASKVDRKWFERFVVFYRKRKGAATASPGPASKEDTEAQEVRLAKLPKLDMERRPIKGGDYEIVWTIGGKEIAFKNFKIDECDFFKLVKNMSPRPKEQAHKYLCSLVGCEWNTQHAFDYHDELIAVNDDNGDWFGWDYESEQDKAERLKRERIEKEEKARAAAAAAEAQKAEELARQQAEQIRKDREEAERKEREKVEAEKRRQEGEERAKREAAEREEREKEEAAFNEKFASVLSLVSDECRERLSHDIQNESLWAKMKPDGAKDRFRIRIRLKVGDELTEKVIAALEASNLHWWNSADERKQLAEKHVNALLEKTVENGCTEGEAAAAAAKAQQLKAKYGIGLIKLVQKETDEAAIS
jgi:Protein of unknown function (DUF2786)